MKAAGAVRFRTRRAARVLLIALIILATSVVIVIRSVRKWMFVQDPVTTTVSLLFDPPELVEGRSARVQVELDPLRVIKLRIGGPRSALEDPVFRLTQAANSRVDVLDVPQARGMFTIVARDPAYSFGVLRTSKIRFDVDIPPRYVLATLPVVDAIGCTPSRSMDFGNTNGVVGSATACRGKSQTILVDGQPFPRIGLEPLAEEGFFEPDDAGVLVARGAASARSFRYQKQMYVFGMLLRDAPWYDVSIRLVPRAALLARLSHWSEQEGISTRNGSLGHLSTSHLSASQAADIEGLPAGDCDKNWSIVHDAAARTIQTSPRGRDVESCLLLLSAKPRPPREGMFALALALGSSARNRAP